MVKSEFVTLASAMVAALLVGCVPPKAVVVENPPAAPKPAVPAPEPAEVPMPGEVDDGYRLPENILAMPGDGDFRATMPAPPAAGAGSGAVMVRPPTDPPPRPKPKEQE